MSRYSQDLGIQLMCLFACGNYVCRQREQMECGLSFMHSSLLLPGNTHTRCVGDHESIHYGAGPMNMHTFSMALTSVIREISGGRPWCVTQRRFN